MKPQREGASLVEESTQHLLRRTCLGPQNLWRCTAKGVGTSTTAIARSILYLVTVSGVLPAISGHSDTHTSLSCGCNCIPVTRHRTPAGTGTGGGNNFYGDDVRCVLKVCHATRVKCSVVAGEGTRSLHHAVRCTSGWTSEETSQLTHDCASCRRVDTVRHVLSPV